jgi:dienelactone hydrolase
MKLIEGKIALFACLLVLSSGCQAHKPQPLETKQVAVTSAVTLTAKDGVKVFGTYYAAPAPKALILLFHQAGSNKTEYASIAPRLAKAGYSALAIDQRSGGKDFGAVNETVKALRHSGDFMDVKRDLEAALAWSDDKQLPVIIWGSSYSASLVYVLAAENPDKIRAALAFSGGDYLDDHQVMNAMGKITVPLFATSGINEVKEMRPILERAHSSKKVFFVPKLGGVHGSATLIAGENQKGAEENWMAVLEFLSSVTQSSLSTKN